MHTTGHLIHHLKRRVYDRVMARTNIDIDDRLIASVMQRYGLRTKRAAVDLALRRLVGEPPETGEILLLEGSGWQADLDEIRTSRVANDR
jgi:Arc/MetJ family transcription regulator